MNMDLFELKALLRHANTMTPSAIKHALAVIDTIDSQRRACARALSRSFAVICETFAESDMEQMPAELRQRIETIALGGDLPEQHASGPVGPMELLQIAHRVAIVGERTDAARLRMLADALVAAPTMQLESRAWTDDECLKFASVAFRHAPKNLPKGVELEDIRLGAMRVARGAMECEGGAA